MFGLQIGRMGRVGGGLSDAQKILALFKSGEQGAIYDPSDMSTLFQDSAGTVPVTAVEQPVGKILDKSGRGNHATQATATARPVLSARVNPVLATENFAAANWARFNVGAAADKLTPTATFGPHLVYQSAIPAAVVGNSYTHTMEFKAGGYEWVAAVIEINGSTYGKHVNLTTGAIGGTYGNAPDNIVVTNAGDGYWRVSVTKVATTTAKVYSSFYVASADGVVSFAGDGTSAVFARKAQLDAGTIATPYQRVTTYTNYDADPTKFPAYLRFDGVDDALQTGNIDFTSTDKMTVWAGVTKLSDAATGTVVELSATKSANNGVFALFAPLTLGSPDISWYSKGTSERLAGSTSESAPVTLVTTGIGDISGDISSFRVNGAVVQTQTADQGTGNFGNYPIYIGARAGTSLYFNGRLYGLIVRGAQSSLLQIEATELYMKKKVGIA